MKSSATAALAVWAVSWAGTGTASAQQRAIDTAKSVMTVRVFKAGVFSALGHNHEISAPISSGTWIERTSSGVTRADRHLESAGPGELPRKTAVRFRRTMLGADVLDAASHPEIVFRSTAPRRPDQAPGRYTAILPCTVKPTQWT